MTERLQKVLARAGVASRREIEKWISEGRISVNGKPAEVGQKVSAQDRIKVDGKDIRSDRLQAQKTRIILYNKPEGQVCTRKDEEGRPTVFEGLPKLHRGRWINVGRLDINTQGLLLFTNDGGLANYLMHPSQEFEREYAVRIAGEVTDAQIKTLLNGVDVDGETLKFQKIAYGGGKGFNHWYHVVVTEGKNREVRRLWESQGVKVSRLIRVRYATQTLPKALARGRWEEMKRLDMMDFCKQIGWALAEVDDVAVAPNQAQKPFQRTRSGRTRHAQSTKPRIKGGRSRASGRDSKE